MTEHEVTLQWKRDMVFEAGVQEHLIIVDAEKQFGGDNQGPQPKPLMLSALAGCTAMDVVSLLKKMHMPFDSFRIEVKAELTDEHPKMYSHVTLTYFFTGSELDEAKVEKAVHLSQEKYCGVAAMFRSFAELDYSIQLN